MRMGLPVNSKFKPYKTIRANNKFELIYKTRLAEKEGWIRGEIEYDPMSTVQTLVCYMTRR